MNENQREVELLTVIVGLHQSVAAAEKQLEEIRKPKYEIKHGDIGYFAKPANKRLFFTIDGKFHAVRGVGGYFSHDEIKDFIATERYTITGNVLN